MPPEQWDRVRELFHLALDLPPEGRAHFLKERCSDDAIRAEVETLLRDAQETQGTLGRPALEDARAALQGGWSNAASAPLVPGSRLGSYEVLAPLGAGGMGEVYRARDLRLKREVALKVLPAAFASDPDRMARFQREAEVLASLNHPNIAQIYGVEERALVMELVDGKTLSGPLPLPIALTYARQMAEALEYAHEKGVIHRDLKPANIKVTASGMVKVLDFGLAKAVEPAPPSGDPSLSPTATLTATHSGMIMGTAAYMSPEQAAGKTVDKRSDIWSFGVVLWELLTGNRLFQAESVAHTLADVLRREIDFDKLPSNTPGPIRDLLARCLDRDVTSRLRDLGEARVAIQKYLADPASVSTAAPASSRVRTTPRRPVWIRISGGAALLAAVVAAVLFWMGRAKPVAGPIQWRQITNFSDSASWPAISRDGHMLAFTQGRGDWWLGRNEIFVKLLPDGPSVPLTHDNVPKMFPAFSPDGSRIAYTVAGFHTWVVPVLAGGAPQLMLSNAEGLTWTDPQHILFSEEERDGMAVETALENRASQRQIYLPHPRGMAHFSSLSPDGKQVLIAEMAGNGPFLPCRLLPFDGHSPGKQVGPREAQCRAAVWTPDGKWMYFTAARNGASHIWRQRIDSDTPEQLTFGPSEEQGLAMAPDGRSLYTGVGTTRSSVWVHDAAGDRQVSGEGQAGGGTFSRDGTRVYYVVSRQLWSVDLATGRTGQVLPGVTLAGYVLSGDGRSMVYGTPDKSFWIADLDRRSPPRKLPLADTTLLQVGASGKVYFTARENGKVYLYSMNADGSDRKKLLPDLPGTFRVSPDERWVLDPAARGPKGVHAYPLAGGKPVKLSQEGQSRWSADGRALLVTFRAVSGYSGITVAVPLKAGQSLPPIPPGGFRSPEEFAKLPGALTIPYEFADVGPRLASYVYTKQSHQENIFQMTLP